MNDRLFYHCWVIWITGVVLVLSGCGHHSSEVSAPANATICHQKFYNRAYNRPYEIRGIVYTPQKHYNYSETGIASYYGGGDVFHGRKTSNGERFDMNRLSAAHKTVPIPCVVLVTNLENGRSLRLKINDRGPFIDGRIIDVSRKAARLLGFENKGLAKVKVEALTHDSIVLADAMARGLPTTDITQPNIYLVDAKPAVSKPASASMPKYAVTFKPKNTRMPHLESPALQLVAQKTLSKGAPRKMSEMVKLIQALDRESLFQKRVQAEKYLAQIRKRDPAHQMKIWPIKIKGQQMYRVADAK